MSQFDPRNLFELKRQRILATYNVPVTLEKSDVADEPELIKSIDSGDLDDLQFEDAPQTQEPIEEEVKQQPSFENLLEKSNTFVSGIKKDRLQKSFDVLDADVLLKAKHTGPLVGRAGLHPEKVDIHMSDGTTHKAIRWVSTETGKAPARPGFASEDDLPGATIKEKIENVHRSGGPLGKKVRNLGALGVYDHDHLEKLGGHAGYPKDVIRELGVDRKQFDGVDINEDGEVKIPTIQSSTGAGYKPPIDVSMSMEQATKQLSKKDYAAFTEDKMEAIKKKFGIGAKQMWASYNIDANRIIKMGQPKSMIVYGTGGVGKTWTLEQILAANQIRMYKVGLDMTPDMYDCIKISGSTSKTDLWRKLYENRDKLVVFDDCDSMWDDDDCLNFLKGALDSSGDGTISYGLGDRVKLKEIDPDSDKGEQLKAPNEFQFTGRAIFISNLTKNDFITKGAGPLIQSRCLSKDLTMTMEETIEKLTEITDTMVIRNGEGNAIPVKPEHRKAAIDFITTFKDDIEVPKMNGRTLGNLMGTAYEIEQRTGKLDLEEFVQTAIGHVILS